MTAQFIQIYYNLMIYLGQFYRCFVKVILLSVEELLEQRHLPKIINTIMGHLYQTCEVIFSKELNITPLSL